MGNIFSLSSEYDNWNKEKVDNIIQTLTINKNSISSKEFQYLKDILNEFINWYEENKGDKEDKGDMYTVKELKKLFLLV